MPLLNDNVDDDVTDGTSDFGEADADIDSLFELIWRARGVVANAFELSALPIKCVHTPSIKTASKK